MTVIYDQTVELCKILQENYNKRGSQYVRYSYEISEGKKYYKIVQKDSNFSGGSVHAFVDKKTGDLYKAASWAAPAKGVRFNLGVDLELLRTIADCYGSYLYR